MAGIPNRPRKWLLAVALFGFVTVLVYYSGAANNIDLERYRALMKMNEAQNSNLVPEIYGLLNIVLPSTTKHQHLLPSQHAQLLAQGPAHGDLTNLDYGIYDVKGNNAIDWKIRREEIDHEYPIVVFGKSYCPYTKRLLGLLQELPIHPGPFIVQEDLRDDTSLMQDLLLRLTGRRTVPNLILHGQSLGGSDDIHALYQKATPSYTAQEGGKLRELLESAGVKWKPFDLRPREVEEPKPTTWISKQES